MKILNKLVLIITIVIAVAQASEYGSCIDDNVECPTSESCNCCSGCAVNDVCKPSDAPACQLADAFLILILEIVGIAIAILVVIGIIICAVICYCRS